LPGLRRIPRLSERNGVCDWVPAWTTSPMTSVTERICSRGMSCHFAEWPRGSGLVWATGSKQAGAGKNNGRQQNAHRNSKGVEHRQVLSRAASTVRCRRARPRARSRSAPTRVLGPLHQHGATDAGRCPTPQAFERGVQGPPETACYRVRR
jgi:hypothetical protein